MRLHKRPPNMLKRAFAHSADLPTSGNTDEKCDREFRDFIESITVTAEELAAIISMPELSIREVKQFLHGGANSAPQISGEPLFQIAEKLARRVGARGKSSAPQRRPRKMFQ